MQKKSLKIGIIGCGLIGFKRAKAILELKQDQVVGVFDIDQKRMQELAALTGSKIYSSWQSLVLDNNIDAVIVAAYHTVLPKMAMMALKAGKHVLAEKPLGNNAQDAVKIYLAAKKSGKILKVGFNHRFHPALYKAHQLYKKGVIGEIMYIRSIYGHGGRKNYDLEWRLKKKFTRGGELYDQGSHIIDLSYWFLGDFNRAFGNTQNYFWKKTPLEDNAFCQLLTKKGQTVNFQVSLTQWKNYFSYEIYGSKGHLTVIGLGRSYGVETLTYGKIVGFGIPPQEQVWKFDGGDESWVGEWREFRTAVLTGRKVMSSAAENVAVMTAMDGLYLSAKTGKISEIKAPK